MTTNEKLLSEVLSEFARTMVTDFPIQDILDGLVHRIVELLPITAAGVTLISPNSLPRFVAATDESALRFERLQTELDEGPCLAAYRSGSAVSVPDLETDERFRAFAPQAVAAGLAAVFTLPLLQADRSLGALDLYRDTPGSLSDDEMSIAQTLAEVTAAYLVNAQARDDLEARSARSYENSIHDPLTGLPNRTLLMERLEHALKARLRGRKTVAVIFADLDEFKTINDLYGHQVGDELLIAVGQRLRSIVRPRDTPARLSGDEFVLLCEDLDDEAQGEDIAKRVVAALSVPFALSAVEVEVSASVGIAFAGSGKDLPELLLHDADTAMYQAKRSGGHNHHVVDFRARRIAARRITPQADLRTAIRRHELRLEYQPIVRSQDGRVIGLEALLRWDHPTEGLIPPSTLIPLAEASGLIIDIGRWVLEGACADQATWAKNSGHDDLTIAVNVSPHQLMSAGFTDIVAEVLQNTDTSADLVVLEITESAFLQDSERALVVLRELKRLGVRLALDDFGTGYSSLDYLNRFPIDVLKIDQRFVATLMRDKTSQAIVSAVIDLAHVLGLSVVTEGVETLEQRSIVTALGSDCCQGFLFARPMSREKVGALLGADGCLPIVTAVRG